MLIMRYNFPIIRISLIHVCNETFTPVRLEFHDNI